MAPGRLTCCADLSNMQDGDFQQIALYTYDVFSRDIFPDVKGGSRSLIRRLQTAFANKERTRPVINPPIFSNELKRALCGIRVNDHCPVKESHCGSLTEPLHHAPLLSSGPSDVRRGEVTPN